MGILLLGYLLDLKPILNSRTFGSVGTREWWNLELLEQRYLDLVSIEMAYLQKRTVELSALIPRELFKVEVVK
jgi:hypothetical protein